jgi:3-hydroxy-9,10-secoandrosta-1,3,5(10)-triene-9,17-dione monooxygenase reductase component
MTVEDLIAAEQGHHFRAVLGNFCTGITVLTSTVDGRPVGLTCQSFFSVSLAPPLIAFSVAKSSKTYPLIRRAGTCCVNVLSGGQNMLSNQFARSGVDKWVGVDWYPSPANRDPIIRDVLAWLECDIEQESEAGDHVIVLARVYSLAARPDASPLLYFRGSYARVDSECGKHDQR